MKSKHLVARLLVSTILISQLWKIWKVFFYREGRHVHWDGSIGWTLEYHYWHLSQLAAGLVFLAALFVKERSEIDEDMIKAYFAWQAYSVFSYLWIGYPEPIRVILIGFVLTFLTFVGMRILRRHG